MSDFVDPRQVSQVFNYGHGFRGYSDFRILKDAVSLPSLNNHDSGDTTFCESNSIRYLCPYYIFDSNTYYKCLHVENQTFSRLLQHFCRAHMNWCDRCKQPFHTPHDLQTHLNKKDCPPRAEFPVGYLNRTIRDRSLTSSAVAGMSDQDKLCHIFTTLFKCEPPTGAYFKFHSPPLSEAYGRAKLETTVRHMTDMIARLGGSQLLSSQNSVSLLLHLLRVASHGPMNPTETQRRELSRLSREKAQGGLSPTPQLALHVPDAFVVSEEDVAQAHVTIQYYAGLPVETMGLEFINFQSLVGAPFEPQDSFDVLENDSPFVPDIPHDDEDTNFEYQVWLTSDPF